MSEQVSSSEQTRLERSYRRILARPLSAACFALISLSVLAALAQGTAALAPATMIAAAVVWILRLSSVVLIFTPAACRYYRPQSVQQ